MSVTFARVKVGLNEPLHLEANERVVYVQPGPDRFLGAGLDVIVEVTEESAVATLPDLSAVRSLRPSEPVPAGPVAESDADVPPSVANGIRQALADRRPPSPEESRIALAWVLGA